MTAHRPGLLHGTCWNFHVGSGLNYPNIDAVGWSEYAFKNSKRSFLTRKCDFLQVIVTRNGKKVSSKKFEHQPSAASIHPNQTEIAIGSQTVCLIEKLLHSEVKSIVIHINL